MQLIPNQFSVVTIASISFQALDPAMSTRIGCCAFGCETSLLAK